MASGEFRQDLYFRLNVFQIQVPPLRARIEDVPVLFEDFLRSYTQRRGVPMPRLGPEVTDRLMSYDWPGNVRELRNVVERVVLRLDGNKVGFDDLPEALGQAATRPHPPGAPSEIRPLERELLARMIDEGECFWSVVHQPFMERDLTRENVREVVRLGLEQCHGCYTSLTEKFNMQAADYKRFMSFLRSYHCHIPLQGFRENTGPTPSPLTHKLAERDTVAVSSLSGS